MQEQETREERAEQIQRRIAREKLRLKMLEYHAIHDERKKFDYWYGWIEDCQKYIDTLQRQQY